MANLRPPGGQALRGVPRFARRTPPGPAPAYYATRKMYESTLTYAEKMYFSLLDMNWKPQQARAVLPNSLKTELIMTGTLTQWEGFFKLRDAGSAHPQAYELAHPLHEEFIKRGWIK